MGMVQLVLGCVCGHVTVVWLQAIHQLASLFGICKHASTAHVVESCGLVNWLQCACCCRMGASCGRDRVMLHNTVSHCCVVSSKVRKAFKY